MLTIHGKTITMTNMRTAAADLAPSLKPVAEAGQPSMALLGSIIFQALNTSGETFTEKNVAGAYQDLMVSVAKRAEAKAAARETGKNTCESSGNKQARKELDAIYKELQPHLQELEDGDQVVIFRGVDPFQALAILEHRTFGGLPPALAQAGAPQTADAGRQSGFGTKDTAAGRIEEWSLAPQTGFATDGFMLVALTHPSKVNLPDKGNSRLEGERGVVGYADHSLERVAIWESGRGFVDVTAESLEIQALMKMAGRDASFVLDALRAAG
ncbi:MAG: hypothetical protein ACRDOO_23535 [Actinomadura sp.]